MELKLETSQAEREEQEFTKRGDLYIVPDGQEEGFSALITPRDGLFDVQVWKGEEETDAYSRAIYGSPIYEEKCLHTRELTVENAQKTLDEYHIKIPDRLVEELSEWRREFLESPEHADEMRMAAAEAGDLDGQLTLEEVEMIYGPKGAEAQEETSERLRVEFGSALAEAQGIAEYESQLANLERSSPDDNHAQEQSLELEDGEDHSFSF